MSVSIVAIDRKRGDTRRIVFQIKDSNDVVVDITSWTNFLLTVDPDKAPVDNTNNVGQITGVILDGPAGRVSFSPDGSIPVGKFNYDAQALDDNAEKVTFVEGKYVVTQDITKD